jgi:hypothetical protein
LNMLCQNWGQFIVSYCFIINGCMCAVFWCWIFVFLYMYQKQIVCEISADLNHFCWSKIKFLSLKIQIYRYKNIYWILYFQS